MPKAHIKDAWAGTAEVALGAGQGEALRKENKQGEEPTCATEVAGHERVKRKSLLGEESGTVRHAAVFGTIDGKGQEATATEEDKQSEIRLSRQGSSERSK